MTKFYAHPSLIQAWETLYSGDKITEQRVRGVIEFKNCLWIVTGAACRGNSVDMVRLQECVPISEWRKKTWTYEDAARKKPFTYAGIKVTVRGQQYVMVDTKVEVFPDASKRLPRWEEIEHRPIIWPHTHTCIDCKKQVLHDDPSPCCSSQYLVCKTCSGRKREVVLPRRHVLSRLRKQLGRKR